MAKRMQDQCQHDRLMIELRDAESGEVFDHRELTRAEVEAKAVDLPERQAMSLVNANLAVPINLAAALNVLSDSSTAGAVAQQITPIDQSNL